MLLTYNGPHSGVVVITPGGGRVVVAHGGRADFPDAVADSLLAQGEDHWREAEKAAPKNKAERAPENKADAPADDTPKEVN